MNYLQIIIDGHWCDHIPIPDNLTKNQLDNIAISWAKSNKISTAGMTYSILQIPEKKPTQNGKNQ